MFFETSSTAAPEDPSRAFGVYKLTNLSGRGKLTFTAPDQDLTQQQTTPSSSSNNRAYGSVARYGIREYLRKEVTKAKRHGYWFRLGRLERQYLGLALRINVKWKSPELLRALVRVLRQLKGLGDRAYLVIMKGTRLAWQFSEAVVSWGNPAAKEWRNDLEYAKYLGSHMCGNNWGCPG